MKRQRIEDAGGVRPRGGLGSGNSKTSIKQEIEGGSKGRGELDKQKHQRAGRKASQKTPTEKHRFGRVMDQVPCRNKARFSTVSIALPGSIVTNCQTKELQTYLVGQIARAATIWHVDEVVVFDDKLSAVHKFKIKQRQTKGRHEDEPNTTGTKPTDADKDNPHQNRPPPSESHEFMARVLQFCECPQYLRRHFFPMHIDLQFAGLLAPVDAPHHVRVEDRSKYREGLVLEKVGSGPDAGSLVNCGIRNRFVEIDKRLTPGIRCTVKLSPTSYGSPGVMKGEVVSPSAPKEDDGTYWGYTTRLSRSLHAVFEECPYEGGYDLKIGTSERGDQNVESKTYDIPNFKHALIVFGGVAGLEECVDADESLRLPGSLSRKLFDQWVNICPFQGSRTIRTEEAVMIGLSKLSPLLASKAQAIDVTQMAHTDRNDEVELNDGGISDETSESELNDDGASD